MNDWDLYDKLGQRKYLTTDERLEFFNAITPALSDANGRTKRTFALMLYYTGCRISEGLNITAKNIDYSRKADHEADRANDREEALEKNQTLQSEINEFSI